MDAREYEEHMLNIDARTFVEERLAYLRQFRNAELDKLDKLINTAEDDGNKNEVKRLRNLRKEWRKITDHYKSVLSSENVRLVKGDPFLGFDFDTNRIVDLVNSRVG